MISFSIFFTDDNKCKIWDLESGKQQASIPLSSAGVSVKWNKHEQGKVKSCLTDLTSGHIDFKVSYPSRKFEFNVFSIIYLNGHNFDVLDRFQENKVLQTAQIMNTIK